MKGIPAPEGGVYRQERTRCNKPGCKKCESGEGHGSYWYRYWWEDGKTRKKYVGKTLPADITEEPQAAEEGGLDPTVKRALEAIRDYHAQGIEPTTEKVAQKAGLDKRPLGRLMKEAGFPNTNCWRDGVKARRYVLALKGKVEEALR